MGGEEEGRWREGEKRDGMRREGGVVEETPYPQISIGPMMVPLKISEGNGKNDVFDSIYRDISIYRAIYCDMLRYIAK